MSARGRQAKHTHDHVIGIRTFGLDNHILRPAPDHSEVIFVPGLLQRAIRSHGEHKLVRSAFWKSIRLVLRGLIESSHHLLLNTSATVAKRIVFILDRQPLA
jgi:hypothetical protein